MSTIAILTILAVSGVPFDENAEHVDARLYSELRAALNDVCAYLALGELMEARRVLTDGSPVVLDTPFGPVIEDATGLLNLVVRMSRSRIAAIVRNEVAPPPDAEFKAYKEVYNPRLKRDYEWFNSDGYDTVTVTYKIGEDSVQISQTTWLLALTIEGPDTATELTDQAVQVLPERARSLMKRFLILEEEPLFDAPKRHTRCLTAVEHGEPPKVKADTRRDSATSQAARSSADRHADHTQGAMPPAGVPIAWWTDGKRFGFLLFKPPGGITGAGPGTEPNANRGWFRPRRTRDTLQRMAAEYRVSTMPTNKQVK